MAAIPPNTKLDGFIASMKQGVEGAFNRGVKYGRYLEQQECPRPIRCKRCMYFITHEELPGATFCLQLCRPVSPDFYCAYGEKREVILNEVD